MMILILTQNTSKYLKRISKNRSEITKKEVAWGIEYRKISLEKLMNVYFDCLHFKRFTVKSIKNGSFVSSFRVKMNQVLEENVRRFKEMIEKEYHPQSGSDDDIQSIGSSQRDDIGGEAKSPTKLQQTSHQFQNQNQNKKKNKTEAELKREARTKAREERKRELEKHEKEEAKWNQDNPEDIAKVEQAKNSFNDYKLKMSSGYIVPEKERVNAEKKRQQMVLLENSIFNLKVDFNKKLEELKTIQKQNIIEMVTKGNKRLLEINTELNIEEELFYPQIDEAVEYPENFYKVNMEDIIKYNHKKAKESKVVSKTSMFGSKKDDGTKTQEEKLADEFEKAYRDEQKLKEVVVEENKTLNAPDRKSRQRAHDTEVDLELKKIRQIELEYEKDQIKTEINNAIESFDIEISELQKEKYRLESDLKQAEMKLITYCEELIILNGMEYRDKELTKSLAECRKDKGKILKDINEISKELKGKKREIEEIREKEEELMKRFHSFCPEGSPMYEDILNFFKKITGNRRKGDRGEGGDGDEDDDVDDEIEDEEDDEANEASYKFNQEEHKIDDIEKLRDERNQLYADKQKIESAISELEKNRKKLEISEASIKQRLEDTEEMIQDFQKEKMDKLNVLTIPIVLKISQMQNLEKNEDEYKKWEKNREEQMNNGDEQNFENSHPIEDDWRGYFLPKSLKDSTLFTREGLLRLIERKRELDIQYSENNETLKAKNEEKKAIKMQMKANRKMKKQKLEEYAEKQMLRFGDLVDLDSLEVSGPSQVVIDLRNNQLRVEKECMRKREEAEAELEGTQRELTKSVKENTGLLELIIELGKEQID